MLTIFCVPRPFERHFDIIQRNAISSWKALRPRPEIILFGDEAGIGRAATELEVRHVPAITRNEFGTPLLSDVMAQANQRATNRLLCYVAADIILLGELINAVNAVANRLDKFLIVARRINVDVKEPLRYDSGWEGPFREQFVAHGILASPAYHDIFVFPKGTFVDVPPFAVGRPWSDHWLIKAVCKSRVPIVDVTPCTPIIHQNHDYSNVDGGRDAIWRSEETHRNLKLYGKFIHNFTMADATYQLQPSGALTKTIPPKALYSVRDLLWELLIQKTFPLRKRLGLRRENWRRIIPGKQA
jgi:hypothetical protein